MKLRSNEFSGIKTGWFGEKTGKNQNFEKKNYYDSK